MENQLLLKTRFLTHYQPLTISKTMKTLNTLETTETSTVQQALQIAKNQLNNFASSADFKTQMQIALGNQRNWETTDLINFPAIEIRPAAEINNARGAFAAATNTIYLSQELVNENTGNVGAIASVLLEEYGHYIDAQLNAIDSPGDEGELFANLVHGKILNESDILSLWNEDDSAIVVLDGERVSIEQQVQPDTLNFKGSNVAEWARPFNLPERIPEKPFLPEIAINKSNEPFTLPGLKFDWDLNVSAQLDPYIKLGQVGKIENLDYPVNIQVNTPNQVKSGESFSITAGEPSVEPTTVSINGKGFELPRLSVDLKYNVGSTGLKNIVVGNPAGQEQGGNILFPGFSTPPEPIPLLNPEGSIDFLDGIVSLKSKSFPKGISLDKEKKLVPDSSGLSQVIVTGRENFIEGSIDIDKIISQAVPQLKILEGKISFPNDNSAKAKAKEAQEYFELTVDGLRNMQTPESLQVAEDALQEKLQADAEATKAEEDLKTKRLSVDLKYELLDLKAVLGLALQQDIKFDPEQVLVTMSIPGQEQGPLPIGSSFTFNAPTEGCGLLEVNAKYELKGQLTNEVGMALQFYGQIGGPALSANIKSPIIGLGNPINLRLFNLIGLDDPMKLPPNGFASDPQPIIGTKGLATLDPIDVKDIVVEKTYKIPYNLPVSISDSSVQEGDSGTKDMVFPVTLRDTPKEAVTLSYSSPKGNGSVTIAAGQTSGEIKIPVTGDTQKEADETFTLTVKDQNGKLFADCKGTDSAEATGTIIDDDDEDKPKPPQPEIRFPDTGDPHLVTFDGLHYDFQSVGEFILVKSTTGDLEIQVRQQPFNNSSSVSMNTAVATKIDGQRVAFYGGEKTPLLVDGKPTDIPDNSSISVGSGSIHRKGKTYRVVLNKAGEQLVVDINESNPLLDVNTYLAQGREGQIVGLGGNNNGKTDDDITLRDGTVLSQPITPQVLYGKYEDSWRISQAESFFDYKPGQNTETFTNRYFPSEYVTIDDLDPADRQKAEQMALAAGITDPTILQSAIIDLVLSNFDESFLQSALRSKTPESSLIIRVDPEAKADFTSTFANTPVKINPLSNDIVTTGIPLSLTGYDQTSAKGGTIQLDNNGTPDDKTDDQLTYTPPTNFVGIDTINYTIADDQKTATGTITVAVPAINLNALNGNNGFTVTGAAGNFAGSSLSNIGDFNGDTIDDFIVGGFAADPNNINATGETYVVFGTNQGFPANFDLSTLNGTNGFIIEGFEAESFSGGAVSSAGDINGDGLKDLIIGAFASDSNSLNDSGRTYVILGSNQGFSTRFNLANLNGKNGFAINSNQPLDYSGLAVSSAGDFNNDGLDDLAVAAPAGIDTFLGKVYIVYGRLNGFPPAFNPTDLQGDDGIVINHNNGLAGTTVSNAGDINGDQIDDLIIGAEQGSLEGNPKGGETYVLFGKDGGYQNGFSLSNLDGTNGFTIKGDGYSVSSVSGAGDINADGLEDIIIGVSQSPGNNQTNAGKAYVVFGTQAGFTQQLDLFTLNGNNGFVINGIEPDELLGGSVKGAGDINGDKIDDIIIGASGATTNGIKSAGKTYIVFGSNQGFPASLNSSDLNGEKGFFINGTAENELSGVAVSSAGDINKDSVNDILIGAPGSLFDNTAGKSYVVFGNSTFGNQAII
ncbi:MAG: hypothetical protein AUK43_02475 [Oscillatoriales cyanobacterium CG2_30_40_61]|nr:MAG: hypothetical protein AUK43_02475 [Oscillatoriales cyanobacterium CG2_30_40_61]